MGTPLPAVVASMEGVTDILEARLDSLLPLAQEEPQHLHSAMRYAVFPGGKRIRPRLLMATAAACGATGAEQELALLAAAAVEFVHCASLVHDDLPCFDDAPLRRGLPSVHACWGESTAVLVGDALIARAFAVLADAPPELAHRAMRIVRLLGRAIGTTEGIIGGQGLETVLGAPSPGAEGAEGPSWALVPPHLVDRYHAMKTAALFRVATEVGAAAAGAEASDRWAELGIALGLAYQLADDLLDVYGNAEVIGKPVAQDAALGRPNAVASKGSRAVREQWMALVERAQATVAEIAPRPEPLLAYIRRLLAAVQSELGG